MDGVNHDASGNVLQYGTTAFTYDAASRMQMANGSCYVYNAEGIRTAKGTWSGTSCGSITAEYLLGQGGEQETELGGLGTDMTWKHTNAYGAGKLLATYDNAGLHFRFTDWLGTERVQVNADGTVEQNCLSLPFGDSLTCTGPGIDATEHHFTGKVRDPESGLDYFGARYYGSNTGRWMSPDWAAKAEPIPYAKLEFPQTLNLYNYVQNNPLSMADADGHNGGPLVPPVNSVEDLAQRAAVVRFTMFAKSLAKARAQAMFGRQAQQKLEAVPTKNSTAARPEINWHLTAPAAHGGIIVQEITTTNESGSQTSHYWEAWPVRPGQQDTAYMQRGIITADDHFENAPGETVKASARYYDGLTLPDGNFHTPGGAGTYARDLPATAVDPKLPTGSATAPVDRTFTAPKQQ